MSPSGCAGPWPEPPGADRVLTARKTRAVVRPVMDDPPADSPKCACPRHPGVLVTIRRERRRTPTQPNFDCAHFHVDCTSGSWLCTHDLPEGKFPDDWSCTPCDFRIAVAKAAVDSANTLFVRPDGTLDAGLLPPGWTSDVSWSAWFVDEPMKPSYTWTLKIETWDGGAREARTSYAVVSRVDGGVLHEELLSVRVARVEGRRAHLWLTWRGGAALPAQPVEVTLDLDSHGPVAR